MAVYLKNSKTSWDIGISSKRKICIELQTNQDQIFILLKLVRSGIVDDTIPLTLSEFFLIPFNAIAKTAINTDLTGWIIPNGRRKLEIFLAGKDHLNIMLFEYEDEGIWKIQHEIQLTTKEFHLVRSYLTAIHDSVSNSLIRKSLVPHRIVTSVSSMSTTLEQHDVTPLLHKGLSEDGCVFMCWC
jgi:hypothetical protein